MSRKNKIRISVAVVFVLTLIPIPYRAAPDWKVWVVDESGKPVPSMTVRFEYQNYSVEGTGHEEDQTTDEQGYAEFKGRRRWATTLQRCFYTGLSAMALAHASFGPHDTVFAFGNGLEGDALTGAYMTDWAGQPALMESHIIVRRNH
jgi:hypothetical protein